MTCKHQPILKFKDLFARKPQYICRHCGVRIEMAGATRGISRTINAVFVAVLVLIAFSSGKGEASLTGMLTTMGIMVGIILLYFVAFFMLLKFGQFSEVQEEEPEAAATTAAVTPSANDSAAAGPTDLSAADQAAPGTAEEPLTQEQIDLMAMYAAYEKQAQADGTLQTATAKPAEPEIEDTCVHKPVKSWKNFIPSRYDFVCVHCGKTITFNARTKRSLNLVFLAIMFAILMPSFNNQKVDFLMYGFLTLLVIVIATVVQIFFVYQSGFDLKSAVPDKPARFSLFGKGRK